MQQRLSELALIPDQIIKTFMDVAVTMQKFLPPGSLIVSDPTEATVEEIDQYDDSYRFDEKNESQVDDTDVEDGDDELDDDGNLDGASGTQDTSEKDDQSEEAVDEEQEPEPEPEKVNPFERKWPWSSQQRNTFKRSSFNEYRSNSMIQNRWVLWRLFGWSTNVI